MNIEELRKVKSVNLKIHIALFKIDYIFGFGSEFPKWWGMLDMALDEMEMWMHNERKK